MWDTCGLWRVTSWRLGAIRGGYLLEIGIAAPDALSTTVALRACYSLSRGRRWEPVFLSSRSEERRRSGIFERRATKKWGKLAPALRVAAKIGPYIVVVLGSGSTTTFVLRLVWPDLLSQRRSRESEEQALRAQRRLTYQIRVHCIPWPAPVSLCENFVELRVTAKAGGVRGFSQVLLDGLPIFVEKPGQAQGIAIAIQRDANLAVKGPAQGGFARSAGLG